MVIIDDVISAGTSIRESVSIIQAQQAVPAGVLIALDRMEKGGNAVETTDVSAVRDVEQSFGFQVASIINLNDLLSFMGSGSAAAENVRSYYPAVKAYRERYGV